jgi:hypothetical protein
MKVRFLKERPVRWTAQEYEAMLREKASDQNIFLNRPTLAQIKKGWEVYERKELDAILIGEIGWRIRVNHCLTPSDLYAIICWKADLSGSAASALTLNGEEKIRSITEKAIFELEDGKIDRSIKTLSSLHFVKEKIASAIFTFYDPVNFGTMGVHSFNSLGWKAKDNTLNNYLDYLGVLREYRRQFDEQITCHNEKKFESPQREKASMMGSAGFEPAIATAPGWYSSTIRASIAFLNQAGRRPQKENESIPFMIGFSLSAFWWNKLALWDDLFLLLL